MLQRTQAESEMDLVAHGHLTENRGDLTGLDYRLAAAMRIRPDLILDFAAVQLLVEKHGNTPAAAHIGHAAIDHVLGIHNIADIDHVLGIQNIEDQDFALAA